MLGVWCVLVASVGAAMASPVGVSVQVGRGGVDVRMVVLSKVGDTKS